MTIENKWIEIEGSVEVDVDEEVFNREFIEWLESKGWCFAGITKEAEKV